MGPRTNPHQVSPLVRCCVTVSWHTKSFGVLWERRVGETKGVSEVRTAGRWVCCRKSRTCHLQPLAQRLRSLSSIVPHSHETYTQGKSRLFDSGVYSTELDPIHHLEKIFRTTCAQQTSTEHRTRFAFATVWCLYPRSPSSVRNSTLKLVLEAIIVSAISPLLRPVPVAWHSSDSLERPIRAYLPSSFSTRNSHFPLVGMCAVHRIS